MKKAEEIDPSSLPFVTLQTLAYLPPMPGIYFVTANDHIIYIGQSQNILERWRNHHKYTEVSRYEKVKIHFMASDGRLLTDQETEYVNFFEPRLNSVIRRKPRLGDFPKGFMYAWILLCVPAWFLFQHFLNTRDWDYYILANTLCLTGFVVLISAAAAWYMAVKDLRERFGK